MLFAIAVGTLCGILAAYFIGKWVLKAVSTRFAERDDQRKLITMIGGIFGAIALAPALFLSVMVGGTLGIRPLVLAVGMIVVTPLLVILTTAMGAWFGFLIARSLGRGPVA